jgi:hypothetical protein
MMRYFSDSRDVRRGQPCNPEQFANLQEETMRRIIPGSGVTKTQFGENVMLRGTMVSGSNRPTIIAMFDSLNLDGDTMEVYMWVGSGWSPTTTTVYKPYVFQKSLFDDGETHTDAIGGTCTYNTTALDARYQRRKLWSAGGLNYTEVQEITGLYEVGERLSLEYTIDGGGQGHFLDSNNAGRHWGVNGGKE